MRFQFCRLLALSTLVMSFTVTACDSQKKEARQERHDEDNFFSGIESTLDLADLKNELKDGNTDFLRSFEESPFPWQQWNKDVLEKARKSQRPVFVLVGSSLGGNSLTVANEISESPKLTEILAENFVCSIADIHVHPELGILSYHLANEIGQPTNFPTLLWLSHEGSPIAWTPVVDPKGTALSRLINNAAAMVTDTWINDSDYAVKNSKRDNEQRNLRLSQELLKTNPETTPPTREEVFRSQTRHLSSLYSSNDRDLDYVGGLIPTSSLELLSLGSISNQLTEEVNQRCYEASTEVMEEILTGALRDQLNDTFFYARRTTDWSVPAFSKSLTTQARVIQALIQVGVITNRQKFIDEAVKTLTVVEKNWIETPTVFLSPTEDPDLPGKFLWNWTTLEEAIGRENLPLAMAAFGLEKNGNIPTEVDPLGKYFRLNSLHSNTTLQGLATQTGVTPQEADESLQQIKASMLEYRSKKTTLISESVYTCYDLATVTRTWTMAAVATGNQEYLEKAKSSAQKLLSDYLDDENGLFRIPPTIPARALDYSASILALNDLYQLTLDLSYLEASKKLADEALTKLKTESGLIAESASEDAVIPVAIVQPTMIFAESSLALMDQALTQLKGLTGTSDYDEFREKVNTILPLVAQSATVNHTDFLATCALGNDPLVAVLQGDANSEDGKEFLSFLNSRKHLPFLCVRAESGPSPLGKLSNLPAQVGDLSIVLTKDGKTLGQASDLESLKKLLSSILFDRN